jgi:hypothetical protein
MYNHLFFFFFFQASNFGELCSQQLSVISIHSCFMQYKKRKDKTSLSFLFSTKTKRKRSKKGKRGKQKKNLFQSYFQQRQKKRIRKRKKMSSNPFLYFVVLSLFTRGYVNFLCCVLFIVWEIQFVYFSFY